MKTLSGLQAIGLFLGSVATGVAMALSLTIVGNLL